MKAKARLAWLTAAFAAIALFAVAGGAARLTPTTGPAAAAGPAGAAFKVAVVTDIGGLNDKGFNQLANQGRLRAQKQLGVQTKVYITRSAGERVPNLIAAARAGHDLIIGVGFLMFEPLNTVAPRFPNIKFAGVDVAIELLKKKPKNVRGLLFKEQEAGYLVGYLAGLTVARKPMQGEHVVGAVGALKIPSIDRFIGGYRAGARKANPKVRVLVNYANDSTFSDQAKCKNEALNQIQNNAAVVFQVAGGCGLGALDAAKEEGVWGIGVDADQSFLGPHMLTSATKKVDVAVFLTIKAAKGQGAAFRGGYNAIFDVRTGGVGYGKVSPKVPRADIAKLEQIRHQIAVGKIRPPQK